LAASKCGFLTPFKPVAHQWHIIVNNKKNAMERMDTIKSIDSVEHHIERIKQVLVTINVLSDSLSKFRSDPDNDNGISSQIKTDHFGVAMMDAIYLLSASGIRSAEYIENEHRQQKTSQANANNIDKIWRK
jgi:hypothetical protein